MFVLFFISGLCLPWSFNAVCCLHNATSRRSPFNVLVLTSFFWILSVLMLLVFDTLLRLVLSKKFKSFIPAWYMQTAQLCSEDFSCWWAVVPLWCNLFDAAAKWFIIQFDAQIRIGWKGITHWFLEQSWNSCCFRDQRGMNSVGTIHLIMHSDSSCIQASMVTFVPHIGRILSYIVGWHVHCCQVWYVKASPLHHVWSCWLERQVMYVCKSSPV